MQHVLHHERCAEATLPHRTRTGRYAFRLRTVYLHVKKVTGDDPLRIPPPHPRDLCHPVRCGEGAGRVIDLIGPAVGVLRPHVYCTEEDGVAITAVVVRHDR